VSEDLQVPEDLIPRTLQLITTGELQKISLSVRSTNIFYPPTFKAHDAAK
jgi:hypothetical protein